MERYLTDYRFFKIDKVVHSLGACHIARVNTSAEAECFMLGVGEFSRGCVTSSGGDMPWESGVVYVNGTGYSVSEDSVALAGSPGRWGMVLSEKNIHGVFGAPRRMRVVELYQAWRRAACTEEAGFSDVPGRLAAAFGGARGLGFRDSGLADDIHRAVSLLRFLRFGDTVSFLKEVRLRAPVTGD